MKKAILSSRAGVALIVTFAFVACGRAKHSGAPTPGGDSGEGGEAPAAGSGGDTAAGRGGAPLAGRSAGNAGGDGPSAGSGSGGLAGSSSTAGFSGSALAGAGSGGGAGSATGGQGGGAAGSSAGAPIELVPCNSSDGTGCEGLGYCADDALDSCGPDLSESCSGVCAPPYLAPVCSGFGAAPCPDGFECIPDFDTLFGTDPTSICVGGRTPGCATADDCAEGFTCRGEPGEERCIADTVACGWSLECQTKPPDCAAGYAPAVVQACTYVCVPVQHCGCESSVDCESPSLCDRERGRCFLQRAPAPRCGQAFDPGPCDSVVHAYAFVDGACVPVEYGGCEGNDNRFETVEECLAVCQGLPLEHECPEGRTPAYGCMACGGGGGCRLSGSFCFEQCESDEDCSDARFSCYDGVCKIAGCV